jgi:DNA polymerase I-like protein with 3'-5' exonuclease and polymerase domains
MSIILRSRFPKEKTVLLLNDQPFKNEVQDGEKFSSAANTGLLTALRTGKCNNYSGITPEGYKGIISTDIYQTYLDYEPFTEGNFDYLREVRKRKGLSTVEDEVYLVDEEEPGTRWYKLEHQKDVYISERLYKELQGLIEEIRTVKPKLVVVTGKWSLFFLTGLSSVAQTQGNHKDKKPLGALNTYRASILEPHEIYKLPPTVVVPIFHTVHAMGMPDKVPVINMDLQRLGWVYQVIKEQGVQHYLVPDKNLILGTDKETVLSYLNALLDRLNEGKRKVSVDVETMFSSLIDCIGITDSTEEGLCIPFAHVGNPNYWSVEDEIVIMCKIQEVMLHPNCLHVGQNYSYDCQFFYDMWGIRVDSDTDTMILAHVLYNYRPKDLAFLASLYCDTYKYWKDEVDATKEAPETRWKYNIKDICYTLEIAEVLLDLLKQQPPKLQEFYQFQQYEIAPVLVDVMNTGVRVDLDEKQRLHDQLLALMNRVEKMINDIIGMEINLNSPKQIKQLFTDFLGIKAVIDKKRKTESFGSTAMVVYLAEYPIYRPLITLILEYRSIKVFVKTFLSAKVDDDGRMRTSYNVAGTKSYRLSSRKNARGKGMNLANVPSKGKIDLKYALMEYEEDEEIEIDEDIDGTIPEYEGIVKLPNCKALFLPDEGHTFFNIDYSGADAMVVAWDSDCAWLKNFFNTCDEKLYIYIAREYLQREVNSDDPFYKKIKQFVHLTNYGGMEEKAAASSGLPIPVARELRKWYFSKCPEIPDWHERIKSDVYSKGYIENIFGARFWLLDRNCPTLLNQAYALIPQSTIAILVNKGLVNIHKNERGIVDARGVRIRNVQPLMQIHDAVAGQFLTTDVQAPRRIKEHMTITIPYNDPLVIPADLETSVISYGDCKKHIFDKAA